jgi:hypothetical protein
MPPTPSATTIGPPGQSRVPTWALWLGSFVVALALYGATANRGAQWQDSGSQQVRILTGHIEHPLGLALCHPLHYYLGRAAIHLPISEPAFAITLLSSLAGAIAVANLAATIQLLTRCTVATLIASAAFTLSHTFWQHATYTEIYTLLAAFLTGEWLCLARFATTGRPHYLLLLGLLNGLGIATHLLAALAFPADIAVLIWALASRKCGWRTPLAAAGLWICGTLPYSLLVLDTIFQSGNLADTLDSALFGRFSAHVLNVGFGFHTLALSFGYLVYNFPGLTVPLAIYGVFAALRHTLVARWLVRVLLFELVIYALFVIRYPVPDQYAFFFPVYLLCTLFAGLGLAQTLTWPHRRLRRAVLVAATITAVWTPAIYLGTASALRSRGLFRSMVANKPYRDGYRAFFVPWGLGANYAQDLNAAVSTLAGSRGLVLVEDPMIVVGLHYAQAVGSIPPTVEILRIDRAAFSEPVATLRARLSAALDDGRPVVLVPRDRDRPAADIPQAQWERHGDIYRLTGLDTPTSGQRKPD